MPSLQTIDIDTMPAGREMDALVAEKVMRLEFFREPTNGELYILRGPGKVPRYSTSIATAWEVFLHICDSQFSIRERFFRDLILQASTKSEEGWMPAGLWSLQILRHEFPLAICRAAWKAKGEMEWA